MARYIEFDQKKINRLKREAQQFQDDIVCSVGTDFVQKIAEAENRMIFDILKGLEDDSSADVVPKSEAENYRKIAEHQQSVSMRRYFEIKQLKEELAKAKQEVAKEIFEEIDDAMIDHARGDTTDHWLFVRIAELKKKYTESEGNI